MSGDIGDLMEGFEGLLETRLGHGRMSLFVRGSTTYL